VNTNAHGLIARRADAEACSRDRSADVEPDEALVAARIWLCPPAA
jgi:hypothetical protein